VKNSVIHSRDDLKPYVGEIISCSGRIKEFSRHPTRRDLDSVCLTNVFVTPEGQESVVLGHLWVLRKQLRKAKIPLEQGLRIHFRARVYKYRRLGGKSAERGILNLTDYGLMPIPTSDVN
jgi:hypothetical protein